MVQAARLQRLLRKMVDTYSPSGKEVDLMQYLRGYLKRRNAPVVVQPVDASRFNLLVAAEPAACRLALIGHVDTVPAFDLDGYGYAEHDGIVRGLGAADMKGGCAAMIEAYLALHEAGCDLTPAALCLVVGEEENGDGAAALLRDHRFPWAIVGEPTDLKPCLAAYGYLECQLVARGKRRHAAVCRPTASAIEALLRVVLRVSQHLEKNGAGLVYNIRDIHSSQAGFAVAERCEAWIDIHMPPRVSPSGILSEIQALLPAESPPGAGVALHLRAATLDAGYELPMRGAVVGALQSVYAAHHLPWVPDAFRSHSDANQLHAAGTKPILLGPGRLELAHSEEESVQFSQVCLAAHIYHDLLRGVCRGRP